MKNGRGSSPPVININNDEAEAQLQWLRNFRGWIVHRFNPPPQDAGAVRTVTRPSLLVMMKV
jgi:hypothetical protein